MINNFSGKNPAEIFAGNAGNAVTQTQIAGLVIVNPNLNQTGSAKIILNEVTSGNVSQLLGYTEIAGTKADLILANPNGITCKGCGFINTARLLMVAGKSDFDTNGNFGFNLKEQIDPNLYVPLITIDGLGLDATRVAGTEIIASSVKLLASIYGSENNSLMIKTGDGKYDYSSKNIDSINIDNVNPNSQTSPIFAIDASALAKIQAGQIYLIATKNGVGVKMANEILASRTLNLEADGDIYYQDIAVGEEANLKSSGTIQNIDSNASILAPNVHIQAENFNNSALISAYNLDIKNGENFNNEGNLEALNLTFENVNNINNSGSIFGQNNLEISGKNLINNLSGNIHSPQSYSINLTGVLSNSGLISSENNLNASANNFSNNSKISASNFSANSASFYNSGTIYSANNFNINNIFDLTNSGTLYSAGNFTISSKEIFNNDSAWIYGNKDVSLITNFDFNNFGNLQASLDLALSIGNNTINSGVIIGNQINLNNVGDVANSGSIEAENNINFSAKNLANSGVINSLGNANFNLGENFTNHSDASIYAQENLTLNVNDSLNNSGEISALGNSNISSNNLYNSNKILSNGALNISASSLNNNYFSAIGALYNDVNFTIKDDFINNGQISSAKNLAIFAKNFANFSDVLAGSKLITTIANQITNSGNLQSVNDFSLTAKSLENSGSIRVFGESLINADSINNQYNSLIFFNSNSIINSANSFINSGTILANEKLDLTSNLTTNLGEIFSAKDLKLNLSNSFTNVGTLSSLGSLDITSNSSIINNNQILSDGNLNISAINLNNADKIQANGDIVFNITNLTNANKIISGGNFNITTAGNVANNGNLESADNFAINANKLTNSQFAIILANNNLTLQALSIENQNTKPLNSIITSGIVSNFGVVDILTDNLNNNGGLIASKATTLKALNAPSVNLDNSFGAFVSTEEINLNLGALDYTITGNITASNIDITANNIFNRGNVTASDFIKLKATGDSNNAQNGNIINGLAGGDNSNILLASGSYIDFIAKNNIENYGTILGSTDLTLTSTYGNINNYNNGKITTGSGLATINAVNGTFNNNAQTALFTANNNAIFNAKNLNNFGEISLANDLTTNITNNLTNNPTALIWSGRDAIFNVANIFLNNQADIYADRNLTIQKNTSLDPTQNKTNLVQNISGSLETYSGDINIKAVTLENKRSSMKTQGGDYVYGQAYVRGGDCHRNWKGKLKCNPVIYRDLHAANIYGIAGLEASVLSGGGINITANNFLNDASSIISSANFGINTSNFNNNSYSFVQYNDNYRNYEYYTSFIKSGGALTITQNGASKPSLINGSNVASFAPQAGNSKQVQSTKINHIDNFQLAKTGILAVDLSSIINAINNGNVDDLNLANPQINNLQIDKTDIVAPTSTPNSSNVILAGNFKINLDPSATTPLVESRSQFTDASKFFGSSYYFEKLGFNQSLILNVIDGQNNNQSTTRILGDAFIENKLILDQLRILTNDSLFLNKNINNSNLQIKELLDNSIEAFLALGLDPNEVALNGLNQDQINSLTKNIITFEATKVNGISVLAPKIYLTRETRNRLFNANSSTGGKAIANSSTIFAQENLTIDSPNAQFLNAGSITSDLNLTLNLDSLVNKTKALAQAQIIAGNNLAITAQNGDIKNIGAKMASNFALSLSASNGNILNSAIVQTNDQNLLNQNPDSYQLGFNNIGKISGNISSTLLQDASIKAGSIAINAGGDFNNLGADITATKNISADGLNTSSGNISITAGGDINISTLQLRNREENAFKSRRRFGIKVIDTSSNIGSDIESAGNLNLNTTGLATDSTNANFKSDINIIASNIATTANDSGIIINANDSVNITSAVDLNNSVVISIFLMLKTLKA